MAKKIVKGFNRFISETKQIKPIGEPFYYSDELDRAKNSDRNPWYRTMQDHVLNKFINKLENMPLSIIFKKDKMRLKTKVSPQRYQEYGDTVTGSKYNAFKIRLLMRLGEYTSTRTAEIGRITIIYDNYNEKLVTKFFMGVQFSHKNINKLELDNIAKEIEQYFIDDSQRRPSDLKYS